MLVKIIAIFILPIEMVVMQCVGLNIFDDILKFIILYNEIARKQDSYVTSLI